MNAQASLHLRRWRWAELLSSALVRLRLRRNRMPCDEVDQLLRESETRLGDRDARRRRATLAHLGAVAGSAPNQERCDRAGPYRCDLAALIGRAGLGPDAD